MSVCNWEYTGEVKYRENKRSKAYAYVYQYKTDCGKEVWSDNAKAQEAWKRYITWDSRRLPYFPRCPYCGGRLNFYNPYDDGETYREVAE